MIKIQVITEQSVRNEANLEKKLKKKKNIKKRKKKYFYFYFEASVRSAYKRKLNLIISFFLNKKYCMLSLFIFNAK